jgi:translation initiation factor IF-2
LDMVLLAAEMEINSIKANPEAPAAGTIIDARIDKGEGPVATVLIQNGTLRIGDQLIFNGQIYGKVRGLKNYRGENIKEALPSTPVKIIGLKISAEVGDLLETGEGEKIKTKKIKGGLQKTETKYAGAESTELKKINLVIKSDVFGSAEAIEESLEKIGNADVRANILSKGLGNINDSDISRAEAAGATVIGFNVKATPQAEELARDRNVPIKLYRVIYDLLNDVKQEMQNLLEPEVRRIDLGKLMIKAIFRSMPNEQILGGKVTTGHLEKDSLIEVERDGRIVGTGTLLQLQAGKEEVSSVDVNQECGIKYKGEPVKESDILIFYKEEKIIKKL